MKATSKYTLELDDQERVALVDELGPHTTGSNPALRELFAVLVNARGADV